MTNNIDNNSIALKDNTIISNIDDYIIEDDIDNEYPFIEDNILYDDSISNYKFVDKSKKVYSIDKVNELLTCVILGENIMKLCGSRADFPSWSTLCNWRKKSNGFNSSYLAAKQFSADAFSSEIIEIAKNPTGGKYGLASDRSKFEAYRWLASTHNPREYGNKNFIEANITNTFIGVVDEISRLRTVKESPKVIDINPDHDSTSQ